MDTTERLENHEKRIEQLEGGQEKLDAKIQKLSDQILDGNARNDESNKFLREQNSKMLTMLGGIQQKKQEAHIWTWKAIGKIAVTVGGVASVISIIVNYFFNK
ncbi:hypothetical protein ACFP7A_01160 [Sporolactobacillus kofuensis]|uniref:Uncharacterized protein n=1 Tax=Sporolactobacillus kofuensis TaxID=269672 RepID=A0ABW1WDL8_9BACL|nr:hypothetical protein [Sporolactobacillus kofuensis]MCO7177006.1 hypothetical protein [Sporolactobacillus kofuensis]